MRTNATTESPWTDEDVEVFLDAWFIPGGWNRVKAHAELDDDPELTETARERAKRALATIGPIIERERRAAKVEALREAAAQIPAWGNGGALEFAQDWLTDRADVIERGER